VLAAASLAAMLSGVITHLLPAISWVRELVPASLPQTRGQPGLAEGVFLVALAAVGTELLRMGFAASGRRGSRWPGLTLGWATIVGCVVLLGVATPSARQLDRRLYLRGMGATSYAREVGLALSHRLPKNSVLFIATSRNPECCSEAHSLIFYSGKMSYIRSPDPRTALAHGYVPFLVSPMAEPYEPVPGVPAHAWWRAYDLSVKRDDAIPLPPGLTPVTARVGVLDLLGIARGPAVRGRDRWVLVARLRKAVDHTTATLAFKTRKGVELVTVNVDNALVETAALARAGWFVLPFLGPERSDVIDLHAPDGTSMPLPPDT